MLGGGGKKRGALLEPQMDFTAPEILSRRAPPPNLDPVAPMLRVIINLTFLLNNDFFIKS